MRLYSTNIHEAKDLMVDDIPIINKQDNDHFHTF